MLKAIGIPTIAFSKVFLHNIPPVPTSYCSCMLARCVSPFEGGRGDVSSQASHLSLHHIVRVCLSVTSPPLKGAGGMFPPKPLTCPYIVLFVSTCPSHLPFEGSPRASAAEYVLGGMFPPNPKKNSTSLTSDYQPLNNYPQKNFKKKCQKICRIKKTPYLCTRK